jgi:glutathione S-transferase
MGSPHTRGETAITLIANVDDRGPPHGQGIILHQYPISPYTEKVRIVLGIKRIAWLACTPPVIAPKPDLVALTGGYRRIPVMQIGADIYCDSQLIIRTLDRIFPEPPLHTSGAQAMNFALGPWFDSLLTETAVPLVFRDVPSVDPAFARDRELVMERPFVDLPRWRAAAPHAAESLRAQLSWIDLQLSDGREWLAGENPGLIDAFAYPNLGFLRSMRADTSLIDRLPLVASWDKRVSALSPSAAGTLDSADAVRIARDAAPAIERKVEGDEPNGLCTGDNVEVRAGDYGREPVVGELVSASASEIAVLRHDPRAGTVIVHFPRYGFQVKRLTADQADVSSDEARSHS